MNKLFVIIILAIFSMNSKADWTFVTRLTENSIDDSDYYIDESTIKRTDNIASMWRLRSLQNSQYLTSKGFLPYLSVKTYWEFDCVKKKENLKIIQYFSENMGNGINLFSQQYSKPQWEDAITYGDINQFWKIACAKN